MYCMWMFYILYLNKIDTVYISRDLFVKKMVLIFCPPHLTNRVESAPLKNDLSSEANLVSNMSSEYLLNNFFSLTINKTTWVGICFRM